MACLTIAIGATAIGISRIRAYKLITIMYAFWVRLNIEARVLIGRIEL